MKATPAVPAEMVGFLKNMIRVGMAIGFWMGLAAVALNGMTVACVFGGFLGLACVLLVAQDARQAWKRHRLASDFAAVDLLTGHEEAP